MKINVPSQHQFSWLYSRNKNNSSPSWISWDGKPVRKVPAEFLSNTRIQEFFCAAKDVVKPLFEMNIPKMSFCDIEVDVDDEGFPEPGPAKNRINTIAWCQYPNIYVFGLKPLSGKEIEGIQKEINSHIKKLGVEYNFIYKQYDNEASMLEDFLYNYARHASLITGWNFWGYDWRYIYNRCENLRLDISWMSPSRQWYNHKIMDKGKKVYIKLPQHKLIVDYLSIYKKWDRKVDVKENDTLDFVAYAVLGIKKVKYPGTFQDLYKDFAKYVFYNAIDTILNEQIHNRLKTMQTFLGLGNLNRVEAMSAFSPIAMLQATMARYAYDKKQVFTNNKSNNIKEDFEGAFVFEPDPNLYEWVASFDYASLYPSIMRQFMISVENFIKKDKNYIPKENEIKCSSGAVFDASKEYLLPSILTDFYRKRKESKKISQKAESEMDRLKHILEERKKDVKEKLENDVKEN
ncbi:MAG: DNA polymerase domain-containing protein [Nanoarchaeota archaeon]